jgi:NAD(P)H-dependent FMN reductase
MTYIPVLLGSIRRNRESIKVAEFAINWLRNLNSVHTELLDLKDINLPMMEERLRFRNDPPVSATQFCAKIKMADSVVIVTPEYSSGYPGVLKNAFDYLKDECRRKPFGIITVTSSEYGGLLCLAALRQVILHLGGVPVPASLPVACVRTSFDAQGKPSDPAFHERARIYFDELLWFTEALSAGKSRLSGEQKHGST